MLAPSYLAARSWPRREGLGTAIDLNWLSTCCQRMRAACSFPCRLCTVEEAVSSVSVFVLSCISQFGEHTRKGLGEGSFPAPHWTVFASLSYLCSVSVCSPGGERESELHPPTPLLQTLVCLLEGSEAGELSVNVYWKG